MNILSILCICIALVAVGCLVIIAVTSLRDYIKRENVKEEIIAQIVNREVEHPKFSNAAEQNAYLQGYARCQNDIIDLIEGKENEYRKGNRDSKT